MADQGSNLSESLREFDTVHLLKLRTMVYDRWNWDTGTEEDKRWLDAIEEILTERGAPALDLSGGVPDMVNLKCGGDNSDNLFVEGKGITLVIDGMEYPIVETFGSIPQLSWQFTSQIESMVMTAIGSSGGALRDVVKEAAREAIEERIR